MQHRCCGKGSTNVLLSFGVGAGHHRDFTPLGRISYSAMSVRGLDVISVLFTCQGGAASTRRVAMADGALEDRLTTIQVGDGTPIVTHFCSTRFLHAPLYTPTFLAALASGVRRAVNTADVFVELIATRGPRRRD